MPRSGGIVPTSALLASCLVGRHVGSRSISAPFWTLSGSDLRWWVGRHVGRHAGRHVGRRVGRHVGLDRAWDSEWDGECDCEYMRSPADCRRCDRPRTARLSAAVACNCANRSERSRAGAAQCSELRHGRRLREDCARGDSEMARAAAWPQHSCGRGIPRDADERRAPWRVLWRVWGRGWWRVSCAQCCDASGVVA